MEVVQLKKGGKVKRRRVKTKQPTQTQRQVVNINMGRGGGGAMIGSTHTFSQPPQFYHAIREIPNAPVDYGNNPIRGKIENADPVSGTSVISNPSPFAQQQLLSDQGRGKGKVKFRMSLPMDVPRRIMEDVVPRRIIGSSPSRVEPHDEYKISDQGEVAATASSSVSSSGIGGQLARPFGSPIRGRPPREVGAPKAGYIKTEKWYASKNLTYPSPPQ